MAIKDLSVSRLLIASLSRHGIICIVEDDHEVNGIIKEDVSFDARIKEHSGKFVISKSEEDPNKFTVSFSDVDGEYKEKVLSLLRDSEIVKKNNIVIDAG